MIVSIMQPAYLPWLGYFDRIARSDISIALDTVMLERSSKTRFTNRNKIRAGDSWCWLTAPVKTAGLGQPVINAVALDTEQKWQSKHLNTLLQSYAKAPHFSSHKSWFTEFYGKPHTMLAPMLRESTEYLLDELGIDTEVLYSSEMAVEGRKSELILSLCEAVGATTYLSGPFGRDYLDAAGFDEAGVALEFHDYEHPAYYQFHGGFEPYMSVVDLIFNCGKDALGILCSGAYS